MSSPGHLRLINHKFIGGSSLYARCMRGIQDNAPPNLRNRTSSLDPSLSPTIKSIKGVLDPNFFRCLLLPYDSIHGVVSLRVYHIQSVTYLLGSYAMLLCC